MNGPHVYEHLARESGMTPEVERHLAECSECRAVADALAARQTDLDRALVAFDTAVPFEAAFARAKDSASSSIATRQRRWWETRFNGVILAIAATLTFAVIFGNLFSGSETASFVPMEDVDAFVDEIDSVPTMEALQWPTVRWQRTADDMMDMVYDYDHESTRTDPESKRRLFRLLTALGNSADNGNFANPRIYREPGDGLRNRGYRWAACMAVQDPDLMDREWPRDSTRDLIERVAGTVVNGDIYCNIDEDGVLALPEDIDLTPDWKEIAEQIAEVAELEEADLDAESWGEVAWEMNELAGGIERFASNRREDGIVVDAFAQVARVAHWGTYPDTFRGWPMATSRDGTQTFDIPLRDLKTRVAPHPEFVKRLPTEDLRESVQAYIDRKNATP